MAKKTNTTTKPAAPAKREAKPAAKNKLVAEPAPIKTVTKPEAVKPASPKRAVKPAAPKATKPAKTAALPPITADDIELRAYFIAEKRRNEGLPGDEHQDWVEAERQLQAERTSGKKTKKA